MRSSLDKVSSGADIFVGRVPTTSAGGKAVPGEGPTMKVRRKSGSRKRRSVSKSFTTSRRGLRRQKSLTGRVFHLQQADLFDVVLPKERKIACFCDSELKKKAIPKGKDDKKETVKRKMLRNLEWTRKKHKDEDMLADGLELMAEVLVPDEVKEGAGELRDQLIDTFEDTIYDDEDDIFQRPALGGKTAAATTSPVAATDEEKYVDVGCEHCDSVLEHVKSETLNNGWFKCSECGNSNRKDGVIPEEYQWVWHCPQNDEECDDLCDECYTKVRARFERQRVVHGADAVAEGHIVVPPLEAGGSSVAVYDSEDDFEDEEFHQRADSVRRNTIFSDDSTGDRQLVCFCGGHWQKTTGAKEAATRGVDAVRCDVCKSLQNSVDSVYSCDKNAHDLCEHCYAMEQSCLCVCGESSFQVFRASNVYKGLHGVRCDGCHQAFSSETKVYHCQKGMNDAHPTAVDLCYACIRERHDQHLKMEAIGTQKAQFSTGLATVSFDAMEISTQMSLKDIQGKPVVCYCGSAYAYMKAKDIGIFGHGKYKCDVCGKLHSGDKKVFQCRAGLSEEHESGSFLCGDCMIMEKVQQCMCYHPSMQRMPTTKAYGSVGAVVCDFCHLSVNDTFVYHCWRGDLLHPNGFDLCVACMKKSLLAADLTSMASEIGEDIHAALDEIEELDEGTDVKKRKLNAVPIPCHSCGGDTRGEDAYICDKLQVEKYKAEDGLGHCVFCEHCHLQVCTLTQQLKDEHSRIGEERKVSGRGVRSKWLSSSDASKKGGKDVDYGYMSHVDSAVIQQSSRSTRPGTYNWFLPTATLRRMVWPRYGSSLDPRSLKLVWCAYEPQLKGVVAERVAYIQVKVNEVHVNEDLDAGKANVGVEMTATLYWLFSKEDYVNYVSKGADKYVPTFIPEIEVYNQTKRSFAGGGNDDGGDGDEAAEGEGESKRKCTTISMLDFFGGDIDSRLFSESNPHRFVDSKKIQLQIEIEGMPWVWAVNESKDIYLVPLKRVPDGLYPLWLQATTQTHPTMEDFEMGVVFERWMDPNRGKLLAGAKMQLDLISEETDTEIAEKKTSEDKFPEPTWPWWNEWSTKYVVTLSKRGDLRLAEFKPQSANQVFQLRPYVDNRMWMFPSRFADDTWFKSDFALFCISARGRSSICYVNSTEFNKKLLVSQGKCKEPENMFTFAVDSGTHTPLVSEFASFGLMNRYSVDIVTDVLEPFELNNYPFDFQDIPVRIRALNFDKMLPAFYGHCTGKNWTKDHNKSRFVVYTTSDAVDCGALKICNTVTEFVDNIWEKDELRILFKCRRNFRQILMGQGFLMVALTALNLTVFSIDPEEVADRLAHVFALLLAFLFIEYPKTPVYTYMDVLFYTMFAFSVAVAIQCSVADKMPGNATILPLFGAMFAVILVVFALRAWRVRSFERAKATMDSIQIEKEISLKMSSLTQGTISRLPPDTTTLGSLERDFLLTVESRSENESVLLYKGVRKVKPERFSKRLKNDLRTLREATPRWKLAVYYLLVNGWQLFTSVLGGVVTVSCKKTGRLQAEMLALFVLIFMPAFLGGIWEGVIRRNHWKNKGPWAFILIWIGFASFWIQWGLAIHLSATFSNQGKFGNCRASLSLLYWLFLIWDFLYFAALIIGFVFLSKQLSKYERWPFVAATVAFFTTMLLPFCATLSAFLAFDSGDGCHSRNSSFGFKEVVSMLALMAFFISGVPTSVLMMAFDVRPSVVTSFVVVLFATVLVLFGMHCHALSFWAKNATICSSKAWVNWNFGLSVAVIVAQLCSVFAAPCVLFVFN